MKRSVPRKSGDNLAPKKKSRAEALTFEKEHCADLTDKVNLYLPLLNDMKLSSSKTSICTRVSNASSSWEIVSLFVGQPVANQIRDTSFGSQMMKIAEELQRQHIDKFDSVRAEVIKKFPRYKENQDISTIQITHGQIEQSVFQIFGNLLQSLLLGISKEKKRAVVNNFAHALVEWHNGQAFMNGRYHEEAPFVWEHLSQMALDSNLEHRGRNCASLASAAAINMERFVYLYTLHFIRDLTMVDTIDQKAAFFAKTAYKLADDSGKFVGKFDKLLPVKKEIITKWEGTSVSNSDNQVSSMVVQPTTASSTKSKVTKLIISRTVDEVTIDSDDEHTPATSVSKTLGVQNHGRTLNIKNEFTSTPESSISLNPQNIRIESFYSSKEEAHKLENMSSPILIPVSSADGLAALYPDLSPIDIDVMDDAMKMQIVADQSIPVTAKGLIISLMDQKKDLKLKYNELLDKYTSIRNRII